MWVLTRYGAGYSLMLNMETFCVRMIIGQYENWYEFNRSLRTTGNRRRDKSISRTGMQVMKES